MKGISPELNQASFPMYSLNEQLNPMLPLKQVHDLSDDKVVECWIENPYWQFFSHLKQDFRLGKCFLKGDIGNQINVSLSTAAYNFRKWIRLSLVFFI